ncbi:thiamine diphosphokinase [Pseudobutyrivibrio ruminis]|uniref:thiamine diphosphokinase n=1 Tax=Pseudobutyrivibrio ruminis TaxID=46206 RepID=UPI000427DF08|nr:thiamine diphosphokinase [Pseudobutyrivibrio ruminis]
MIVFIIAGGTLNPDFAKGFIADHSFDKTLFIACDSGFESCLSLGVNPDIVVGDFDSISDDAYKKIEDTGAEVIKLNPIKDDTDTEFALCLAIKRTKNTDEIYILGGTGARIDHTLGNINLLGLGLKHDRDVILVDERNYILMLAPGWTLELEKGNQFGKYISVFPYAGIADGVTMKGFKYPLHRATLEGFNTLTVSNEIVDDFATIHVAEGYLIVCESRD